MPSVGIDDSTGHLYLSGEGHKVAKKEKKRQLAGIPKPSDFKSDGDDDYNDKEAKKARLAAAEKAMEERAKKEKQKQMKAKRTACRDGQPCVHWTMTMSCDDVDDDDDDERTT